MSSNIPENLIDAVKYFSDPQVCHDFIVNLRWPDGVSCPREHCGSKNVHFIASRHIWRCNDCKRQFSIKVGTIFEDSPIGLDKWLPAIWMLTSSKKGVSSYHLAKTLGITQKTAWFMNHRIRLAMKTNSFNKPFSGEVEVDETFLGGKEKNKHASRRRNAGRGAVGKAVVMGILERHGRIRLAHIPNTKSATLHGKVREYVAKGSSVYTDAFPAYNGLSKEYVHEIVDHVETYVRGSVHTNGIENFWSIFKRGIYGIYHSVEPYHLDRYLDEFSLRFNSRKDNDLTRFSEIVKGTEGNRLTYNELIGKPAYLQ